MIPVTMIPTHSRARRATDLPVDAIVLATNAAVEPPAPEAGVAPRAAPGARRLADALARAGVPLHVLAPRHHGTNPDPGLLAHLAAAGLGSDRVSVVGADAAVAGASRARTLVVTRCPEMASGMTAAGHPVAIVDERPAHHAVLSWLGAKVGPFAAASALVAPLDAEAADAVRAHHLRLTKPPGSLGRLEDVGAQLAGIAGQSPPPVPQPAVAAVFAGDHGVHGQGVSPWPQEVTTQMVANFLAGGAAINVLADQVGAGVVVVDVGVAGDVPATVAAGDGGSRLIDRKVRRGTADLSTGPAMTPAEARRALDAGVEVAASLVAGGARCLVTGDMGIANTTPSAALVASLTDHPAARVTGRGTGIDDQLLTRKTALVAAAVARARYEHGSDALAILAEVGGLEHAALAGFVIGGAALQVPVVVDGVVAAAALLVASRLVPGVEQAVIAGHRSAEPGSAAVLEVLGLEPVLDLGLRLGEGTGAMLALPLVTSAARVLHDMATFDQAGVTGKG
ncbi:MAG TPA: nicotinate-nucleotide--dimethylbenzimidazole phosphoribosyltransferase [Acidimicrobiales bacterium]|nr:nicotinate-nucleotide--dimethylbenzimidazole phosphoribosyltransferase [Acidimicrobiales bacterium]